MVKDVDGRERYSAVELEIPPEGKYAIARRFEVYEAITHTRRTRVCIVRESTVPTRQFHTSSKS